MLNSNLENNTYENSKIEQNNLEDLLYSNGYDDEVED